MGIAEVQRFFAEQDLPVVMPGEKLPEVPEGGWRARCFSPTGQPLPGDDMQQWTQVTALKEDCDLKTALDYAGRLLIVSTAYLGLNHNYFGGPALIWETMLFGEIDWLDWQYRYCTQAAAEHAHRLIVEALLANGFTNRVLEQ